MKEHSFYKSILSDYSLGEIDDKLKEEVSSHLVGCAECSGELTKINNTFELYKEPYFDIPEAAYFSSLIPRIREKSESAPGVLSNLLSVLTYRRTAALSLVVVTVVSSILIYNLRSGSDGIEGEEALIYYSGSIKSDAYSLGGMMESLDLEEWALLSEMIEEEIGGNADLFDYYEDLSGIENLSDEEWEEFYSNLNKESIL